MSDMLILIPAAGASSRMRGGDKLLEKIDGEVLLPRQLNRALSTGAQVLVTLPRDRPERAHALEEISSPLVTLHPVDGREGMAVSLRLASAHALDRGNVGLLVMLPDMPDIETSDLTALINAFREAPDRVHRAATDSNVPGHPVILPRRLFPDLGGLRGDEGARALLQTEKAILVRLEGDRAITDLDTPEDWAAWRAARSRDAG